MLSPNRSKLIFSEKDVTSPVGLLGTNDAYDLALYQDVSGVSKGVLVVHVDVQLLFKTGKSSDGKKLEWDHGSKQQFASDYKSTIESVWNGRYHITAQSRAFLTTDIGVMFELNLITSGLNIDEHWEVDVYRTDKWRQSYVSPLTGGSSQHSLGVTQIPKHNRVGCNGPENMCVVTQRPSAHEFGHMLGLNDEYPSAGDNMNWTSDADSVMHSGEMVRPRHYTIFAQWLTEQCATLAHLAKETIEFKVDGNWTMKNAKLS